MLRPGRAGVTDPPRPESANTEIRCSAAGLRLTDRVSRGVVARAVPVNDYDWLVPYDPGVMALWQRGDVAWSGVELRTVGHHDVQGSFQVVLEVRRLAELSSRDWLYVS